MISRNISYFAFLYFLQGLPYGLQARFLPLYLRTHGMSLSNISFFKLLLIPWMLKALWAPFVDKYGTKKKWLMYSMFGLFTTCLFGMFSTPDHLYGLALVLFLFNFLTATQDIAVDGLAVQILATSELAAGNIAQVVWYKIGAVFSGGLLIWLTETFKLRWGTIFLNVGIFYFCAFVFVTKVVPSVKFSQLEMEIMPVKNEENKEENIPTSKQEKGSSKPKNERHWLLEHFKAVFSSKETRWTLGYVLIYKLGEQGSLSMVPLFLVDHGNSASTVEFWTGIVGQATSIFGSLLGGWLVSWFKISPYRAILGFSLVRILWLLLLSATIISWPVGDIHGENKLMFGIVVLLMCTMLLGSGVVTTTTFTLMMYCSQRSPSAIQASHYTTMATAEVLGKLTFSVLIGSFADTFGYSLAFLLFVILAVLVLPVLMNCPLSLREMLNNTGNKSNRK
ncbi:major facilitator superfamily domain-containing protein 3-like [Mya arenaria]|uniref:major facilitator superfamily domain-containing protein 3-like n=1 Tax=Mya arenaria TaxID=6604 RepID=UPI0022E3C455|nr:major facilitator superfamily domain-containing protein 3-like [Mya arenaria]